MRTICLSILIVFCLNALAREDTTYYYGANNKPADPGDALLKRTIVRSSQKKYRISTYTLQDGRWEMFSNTVLKARNKNEFLVREYRDGRMEKMYKRFYSETPKGLFDFSETWNDKLIRTGTTISRIPLALEGKEVRYYESGQKRSESEYRNNQLVSNTNWLINGDKYIDNVFYSVDEQPEYKAGTRMLHKYLKEHIAQSGFNTGNLDGTIRIGFVITEAGEIEGVYATEGIMPEFDEIVEDAVRSIPGEWKPAVLDKNEVNCFLTIPVNFMRKAPMGFENMELSFSNNIWMLHW